MTNFGKFATFGQQVYHYHTTLKNNKTLFEANQS